MKIYKIAADAVVSPGQVAPSNPQEANQNLDTTEVKKAVNSIRVATGIIVQGQKKLQENNAIQYLSQTSMAPQIESMFNLNQGNLTQYGNAAYQIYTNIDVINDNIRIIQAQPDEAKSVGVDMVNIQAKIRDAIIAGNNTQVVPEMQQAKEQASAKSGIKEPTKRV